MVRSRAAEPAVPSREITVSLTPANYRDAAARAGYGAGGELPLGGEGRVEGGCRRVE